MQDHVGPRESTGVTVADLIQVEEAIGGQRRGLPLRLGSGLLFWGVVSLEMGLAPISSPPATAGGSVNTAPYLAFCPILGMRGGLRHA